MSTVPIDVVRNNAGLACALLLEKGPVECAKVALPLYPFPVPEHAMWRTPTGKILQQYTAEAEMTSAIMHKSPQAAACVLFPVEWRRRAHALVESRLIRGNDTAQATELLVAQYMAENNCCRAYARLQLMAADVRTCDLGGYRGVLVYMTYDSTGCHLAASGIDVPTPCTATFNDMQDELSLDEQLVYLVMTNDMSAYYQRVASNQPLALGGCADGPTLKAAHALAFCSSCFTNWDVDARGSRSNIRLCTEPGCDYMVHESCNGREQLTCPTHKSRLLCTCEIQREGHPNTGTPLACSGVAPMHGVWCMLLDYWPAQSRNASGVALLHPMAIESIVETSDDHIRSGRWYALDNSMHAAVPGNGERSRCGRGATCRRLLDVLAEARNLCHLVATGTPPLCWPAPVKPCSELAHCCTASADLALMPPRVKYPELHGLGQLPTHAPPALRLTRGITSTLAALQVYSEPHFSRMCERFAAAGGDMDEIILQWMKLKMPLLPGEHALVPDAAGARVEMHTKAKLAILSAKSRERSTVVDREVRHWIVTQVDPVLPVSLAHDTECMRMLGITHQVPPAPPRARPQPTPDSIHGATRPHSHPSRHGVFAVRLLMNPSLHLLLMKRILADAGGTYPLDGAIPVFVSNEISAIPPTLTVDAVVAFRKACISSPFYGRVYMWLLTHGNQYATAWEHDTTGMLASSPHTSSEDWHGNWTPVAHLCDSTDSTYAAFGCGNMGHWRHVLTRERAAYLFENDLSCIANIAALAATNNNVHLVPCTWQGMNVDALGEKNVVVVTHRKCATVPAPGCRTRVHYMTIHDSHQASSRAHRYMARHPDSEWKHYTVCKQDDVDAAYAYGTYCSMYTH